MGAATLRMRGEDAGEGRIRLIACGEPAALPAGPLDVTTEGTALRPVSLRLRSDAPDGLPAPSGGGEVMAEGSAEHARLDGAEIALDGPAWLVLGESWDRGWRARCDGRDLGEPEPIQGYANGWRVDRPCTEWPSPSAPTGR